MTGLEVVPGSARSRLLASGLLALVVLGCGVTVLGTWRDRIADLQQQVMEAQTMRMKLEATVQRLSERPGERQTRETGRLLSAPTSAQRLAAMQRVIAERAAAAEVTVVSVDPMDPEPLAAGETIGLRVQVLATTDTLQQFLHDLERGNPLLLLETLQVRSRGVSGRTGPSPLDVAFVLRGFAVAETG